MNLIERLNVEATASEELDASDSSVVTMRDAAAELARMETELGRAYRALHGLFHSHVKGERPGDAMIGYHSLTLGAARRFITDQSLDGAGYFEGKHVSVLHDTLAGYR